MLCDLIPFGSRCRSVYQIKRFKNLHRAKICGYPFDHCFAPIKALEKLVSPSFDVNKLDTIQQSGFQKVTNVEVNDITNFDVVIIDNYTGAIFPHETNAQTHRERFVHTYNNFKTLSNSKEKKILVRSSCSYFTDWLNYFGDSKASFDILLNNLKIFFEDSNYTFVDIYSRYSTKDNEVGSLRVVEEKDHFMRYELIEYDFIGSSLKKYDRKNNPNEKMWQGDDQSWNKILNDIIKKGEYYGLS